MSETAKILDRAQAALSVQSDNALAKRLGWDQRRVSELRNSKRWMNLDEATELADETAIPLEEIARAVRRDKLAQGMRKAA